LFEGIEIAEAGDRGDGEFHGSFRDLRCRNAAEGSVAGCHWGLSTSAGAAFRKHWWTSHQWHPTAGLRSSTGHPRFRSEGPAEGLLALDGLEQGLEVPLAEAAGAVAFDHLEEERRAVEDRLGEDLEQVALVVAVDEDA